MTRNPFTFLLVLQIMNYIIPFILLPFTLLVIGWLHRIARRTMLRSIRLGLTEVLHILLTESETRIELHPTMHTTIILYIKDYNCGYIIVF